MPHRYALIETTPDLVSLRPEWDALWATSAGAYFLGFESCLQSWLSTHLPKGRRLRCMVLRDADRLLAVLPMVLSRRAGLWTVAQSLGPEAAEGCDVLMAADTPTGEAVSLFQAFLAAVRPDIVDLPYVVTGGPLDAAVRASGAFRQVTQVEHMPYAVLRHQTSWAEVESAVSRSYQQQTARKRRRLEETGPIEIAIATGAADASIDWLLDEKRKWGEKVGKRGPWLFSPHYRAYLKGLAAAGGHVLTFTLSVGGKPSVVKVIFVGPTLCTLIIAAYDESQSQFSPGNILDEVWIRHVFETYRDPRGRPLDIAFGVGLERYKMHWSRGHTFETKTVKVAASPWGALPYRAKAAWTGLRALPLRIAARETA